MNGNGPCMGYRKLDDAGEAGDFVWFSYNEINTRVKNYASGLVNLKLVPANDEGLKLIAHFSKNRILSSYGLICSVKCSKLLMSFS